MAFEHTFINFVTCSLMFGKLGGFHEWLVGKEEEAPYLPTFIPECPVTEKKRLLSVRHQNCDSGRVVYYDNMGIFKQTYFFVNSPPPPPPPITQGGTSALRQEETPQVKEGVKKSVNKHCLQEICLCYKVCYDIVFSVLIFRHL